MNHIYEENKLLDHLFNVKYGKNEGEIYLKNKLALLVEIGELANEVKCFKYWSIKTSKKEVILEEYADVLMLTMTFFNANNQDLKTISIKENDLTKLFIYLYSLITKLEENLIEIYSTVLKIGEKLEFSEEEIIKAFLNKIEINKQRLQSNY